MLNKELVELLTKQINEEFYSAYLYLDFANYYVEENLDGFANWYQVQAAEEQEHAMAFIKYLQDNGEKVVLEAVDKPEIKKRDRLAIWEEGAAHERHITAMINKIYQFAHEAKDFRTMGFLNDFVKEQMEEEANADEMVAKFKLFGQDAKGLYEFNQELIGRE